MRSDIGMVRLVDSWASDKSLASDIRVCLGKYDEPTPEQVDKVIRRCMLSKPSHEKVFETQYFKFDICASMMVRAQLLTHHQTQLVTSGRHVKVADEPIDIWRASPDCQEQLVDWYKQSVKRRDDLLEDGVPLEVARNAIGPYSPSTWRTTMNLRSLFRMFEQRLSSGVQPEVLPYAWKMFEMVMDACPRAAHYWMWRYVRDRVGKPSGRMTFGGMIYPVWETEEPSFAPGYSSGDKQTSWTVYRGYWIGGDFENASVFQIQSIFSPIQKHLDILPNLRVTNEI